MIRINLVGQKKKARRGGGGGGGASDASANKMAGIGAGVIAAAAALVFFAWHQPSVAALETARSEVKTIEAEKKKLEEETKELKVLQAEKAADEARWESIKKLDSARAVPAWLLWELSNLLTRGRAPQLTDDKKEALKINLNQQWQEGWDAKHVWLIDFEEKSGKFSLDGGAQSDSDATQLALRMDASMFFSEVSPKGGGEVVDKDTGLTFYRFTITGKVRY